MYDSKVPLSGALNDMTKEVTWLWFFSYIPYQTLKIHIEFCFKPKIDINICLET